MSTAHRTIERGDLDRPIQLIAVTWNGHPGRMSAGCDRRLQAAGACARADVLHYAISLPSLLFDCGLARDAGYDPAALRGNHVPYICAAPLSGAE